MNPRTFELSVSAEGLATPGRGVLAAFVPSASVYPALVVAGCDPRQDPGQPIEALAPAAFAHIYAALGSPADLHWVVVDNWGRFFEALPTWPAAPGLPTTVELKRFAAGLGVDAFTKEMGPPGETALEMLSSVIEGSALPSETPTVQEFLDAVQAHGNLPAPGALFQKVSTATVRGDVKAAVQAIQTDPMISATLLNYANAANFAAARKTASVSDAIQRLGMVYVRRVVFIAEMMARYQKGACPAFDYKAYWMNAVATGAAMRGLMPKFGIPERLGDDGFTAGLLAGIGWLAVAETFPGLMNKYLAQARTADPITKARAQNEIFPCPMRKVSETYLARFDFPETIRSAITGAPTQDGWAWFDCLAGAVRAAQGLAPFDCLAVPTTIPVPDPCREEWQRWRAMV